MSNTVFRTVFVVLFCVLQLASIQSVLAFGDHGQCGAVAPSAEEGLKIANGLRAQSVPSPQNQTRAAGVRVYFHVILENQNGVGNVADNVIQSQISVLNRDFSGTGVSFGLVAIDRTVNSAWFHGAYPGTAARDAMYRALRKGGPLDLNIFSTALDQPPPNFPRLLGFATFPWDYQSAGAVDGVVLDLTALPGGTSPGTNTGKIGTHEVGHWVGLLHTFQTQSGNPGCDAYGDYVDDTPTEYSPASGCPRNRDTCSAAGLDPIDNHMDYSDDSCRIRFTTGQVNRFRQALYQYRGATF